MGGAGQWKPIHISPTEPLNQEKEKKKKTKLKEKFSLIPGYYANTGLWTQEEAVWGGMKVGWGGIQCDGLVITCRARELFELTQKGLQDVHRPLSVASLLRGKTVIAWVYGLWRLCPLSPSASRSEWHGLSVPVLGWLSHGRGPCPGSDSIICRARDQEGQPLPPSLRVGFAYLCI